MLREIFGRNIKYHRVQQGLSQEAAADLCSISSKYWGKVERGEQSATVDTIDKISVGLKVAAANLLDERDINEKARRRR